VDIYIYMDIYICMRYDNLFVCDDMDIYICMRWVYIYETLDMMI